MLSAHFSLCGALINMAKNRMAALMARRTRNGPCPLRLRKMKLTVNIILTTFTPRKPNYTLRRAWYKSGSGCANDVAEEKRDNTEIYYYHFQQFHNKLGQRCGFARSPPKPFADDKSHASWNNYSNCCDLLHVPADAVHRMIAAMKHRVRLLRYTDKKIKV